MFWGAFAAAARCIRRYFCVLALILLRRTIDVGMAELHRRGIDVAEVTTAEGRSILTVVASVSTPVQGPVADGVSEVSGLGPVAQAAVRGIDKVREAVLFLEEHGAKGGGEKTQDLEEGRDSQGVQKQLKKPGRWGSVNALQSRGLMEIAVKLGRGTGNAQKQNERDENAKCRQPHSNAGSALELGILKSEFGDDDNTFYEGPSIDSTPDSFSPSNFLEQRPPSSISGDSIGSDDPFYPPGLSGLGLSLTSRHALSGTCIQPGSAAVRSSRSRMSFARVPRTDASVAVKPPAPRCTKSPHESRVFSAASHRTTSPAAVDENGNYPSKFISPTNIQHTSPMRKVLQPKDTNMSGFLATLAAKDTGTGGAGAVDVKSPTQIHRALSTLSFWTPAPKVEVKLAAPVPRRRRKSGRRNDKEGEMIKEFTGKAPEERATLQQFKP